MAPSPCTVQVRHNGTLHVCLLSYLPSPQMAPKSDTKALHRLIRFIARLAVGSFFTEVRVIGGENVPKDGPILV